LCPRRESNPRPADYKVGDWEDGNDADIVELFPLHGQPAAPLRRAA